jgi:hypothetical protein
MSPAKPAPPTFRFLGQEYPHTVAGIGSAFVALGEAMIERPDKPAKARACVALLAAHLDDLAAQPVRTEGWRKETPCI